MELGVVRIGQSEPAPLFRLVAQPNDWEKTVRAATNQTEATGKQILYRAFWSRWIDLLQADRPGWSRSRGAPRSSWFNMTAGIAGATYCTAFTNRGLSSHVVLESPDADVNLARFQALKANQSEMEQVYGLPLDWEEMPGRKSTRVADYLPDADVNSEDNWDQYLDWLLDRQTRLRNALAAVGGVTQA